MGQFLLLLVVALTAAAVVFGVTVLLTGTDPGLTPAEPDGQAVPLPASRPLAESDVSEVRFDTALRGYRMSQVDQAFQRAAYDIGYKDELIGVLEAEVEALREGRSTDADALRRARVAALAQARPVTPAADVTPADATPADVTPADVTPAGVTFTDAKPADATVSTDAVSTDTAPTDAISTDTAPADATAGSAEAPAAAREAESAGPALRAERG